MRITLQTQSDVAVCHRLRINQIATAGGETQKTVVLGIHGEPGSALEVEAQVSQSQGHILISLQSHVQRPQALHLRGKKGKKVRCCFHLDSARGWNHQSLRGLLTFSYRNKMLLFPSSWSWAAHTLYNMSNRSIGFFFQSLSAIPTTLLCF